MSARSIGRVVAGALVAAIAVVSCTVPPRTPAHPGEIASVCRSYCRAETRCGNGDEGSCQDACEGGASNWSAYWRADYVGAIGACFDTVSCTGTTTTTRRNACLVGTRLPPTDHAKATCQALMSTVETCRFLSDKPYTRERCLATIGLLDEDMLKGVDDCTQLQCITGRKYSEGECLRDLAGGPWLP